jgi:RNA polymerase sigma factor (sigma-70 family)
MNPAESPTLEELARRAVEGDRDAVAAIVRALERDVYALSLRMLWHRQDAEDATQEILVRIVTRLSQFDFRSRLRTWAFRVATNALLDVKKSCVEQKKLSFESFGEDLAQGLSDAGPADAERSLLTEEVKVGCTLGMLQCLDRPHRMAYVLGEIFDYAAPEAAAVLDIEPGAFRKRLQRAREAIELFTRAHCGLVSDDAACRCNRRVPAAIRLGRVNPKALDFADAGCSLDAVRAAVQRVEASQRVIELHRSSNPPGSEVDFARRVIAALDLGH